MWATDVSLSALVLLFVLHTGYSLECYTCNVTGSTNEGDPCKGIGSLKKCMDPAVCLSVTYLHEDITKNVKQYATYKSCYPTMDGKECDAFWKMIKDTSPMTAKLEPKDKCYVCHGNDCNRHSYNGASKITVPIVLVGAFSIILTNKVL